MRSKTVMLAATGAALSLFCTAPDATSKPPPGSDEGMAARALEQGLRDNVFTDCVGSSLVKKLIILTPSGPDSCQVRYILPNLGCVVPGGVIRWKVINNCRPLSGNATAPALEIKNLVKIPSSGEPTEADWLTQECKPYFTELDEGFSPHKSLLLCSVPASTQPGLYKYDLEGPKVDKLDPWVVVKGGGG